MGDARAKMGTAGSDAKGAVMGSGGAGGGRILYKAVVVEFLNDPSFYNKEYLEEIFGNDIEDEDNDPNQTRRISNKEAIVGAPRNSCVVRPISSGYDKANAPILAYPFFPPHLCFPVKPGEQVWLITETPDSLGALPLWLCRVPEPLQVDDINFTHGDRKLVAKTSLTTSEKLESESSENVLPTFPNGDGLSAGATSLKITPGNNKETTFPDQDNTYDIVVSESTSYLNFTPEEVPRLTKRPGDFVLQGKWHRNLACVN